MLVGNDIVDLCDPEARAGAQHPRFDARVFDVEEREWLRCAPDEAWLRWTLWAAKESAYKLVRKLEPDTVFSPVSFRVRQLAPQTLRVEHDGFCVQVSIDQEAGALHAVAMYGAGEAEVVRVVAGPFDLASGIEASSAVRRLAVVRLATLLRCDAAALSITKEAGIPRLRHGGARTAVDLSLSHHGRFVAFAAAHDAALGFH